MRLIDEVIVVLFPRLFSIVTKHSFIRDSFAHCKNKDTYFLNPLPCRVVVRAILSPPYIIVRQQ